MFESLRKNIQSVQDGITAGLQRLSSGAPTPTTPPDGTLPISLHGGGADLLTMYQSQWATMHHMALQNAKLAQCVADDISCLTEECETQHSQLLELRSLLAHLPNIMAQLHSSLTTIGHVRSVLEEVEMGLGDLEATIEESVMQEEILDMKMKATLLIECRQHKLNMLHNELSAQHREKLAAAEQRREEDRRMRLETFSEQFQEDLKNYKESGTVGDRAVAPVLTKLEDVMVEDDSSALESFLQDDSQP
ncbi:dysbindin isoform X2 [Hyalella azteca]|uniref:Dysbindin domain-containing protein 1 n=1 Tax=Hyalella azteca TaxID=294128 RepID=A0A8B7MYR0_HYAAZ|nr:dysbindin isoform X1 [Hyalella azteca]XP_018006404.1 dysbindin isoform X2 [Hyalella azteca]